MKHGVGDGGGDADVRHFADSLRAERIDVLIPLFNKECFDRRRISIHRHVILVPLTRKRIATVSVAAD